LSIRFYEFAKNIFGHIVNLSKIMVDKGFAYGL